MEKNRMNGRRLRTPYTMPVQPETGSTQLDFLEEISAHLEVMVEVKAEDVMLQREISGSLNKLLNPLERIAKALESKT